MVTATVPATPFVDSGRSGTRPGRPGPFDGVEDDHASEQGETVLLPMRFVAAPDRGRFYPVDLDEAQGVGIGACAVVVDRVIGEVRNGTTRISVASPHAGRIDRWLVGPGEPVTAGQLLCSVCLPAADGPDQAVAGPLRSNPTPSRGLRPSLPFASRPCRRPPEVATW